MTLPIRLHPDPILSQVCSSVVAIDDELRQFLVDMRETMLSAHGVGIAAPQVGRAIRVFLVQTAKDYLTFINPELRMVGEEIPSVEGCLSYPGHSVEVSRRSGVLVVAVDEWGERFGIRAEGFLATVIQHENDHLDGKTIADREG